MFVVSSWFYLFRLVSSFVVKMKFTNSSISFPVSTTKNSHHANRGIFRAFLHRRDRTVRSGRRDAASVALCVCLRHRRLTGEFRRNLYIIFFRDEYFSIFLIRGNIIKGGIKIPTPSDKTSDQNCREPEVFSFFSLEFGMSEVYQHAIQVK